KGLEAPLVILADTMTPPAGPKQPRLLQLSRKAVIWAGRKADDSSTLANARRVALTEAGDEYRRLLYVAMTRAADRLVVCGATGIMRKPEGCWYDLVFAALQPPASVEEPSDDGDGHVWRYRRGPAEAAETIAAAVPAAATAAGRRPAWLDRDA